MKLTLNYLNSIQLKYLQEFVEPKANSKKQSVGKNTAIKNDAKTLKIERNKTRSNIFSANYLLKLKPTQNRLNLKYKIISKKRSY